MKSIKYILAISFAALFFQPQISACSDPYYSPDEYFMFRVPEDKVESTAAKNCELWKHQTINYISQEDVSQVVYKYDLAQIENLYKRVKSLCRRDAHREVDDTNAFARHLMYCQDIEAAEFLVLAKKCETVRFSMDDPWYYHAPNNPEAKALNDIVAQCLEYKEKRFRSRYALQAVRAMRSLGQFDRCLAYWDSISPIIDDDVVKGMAEEYIAGIYFSKKDYENARRLYVKTGDSRGIINCDSLRIDDKFDEMLAIYKYAPDNADIRNMAVEECRRLEHYYHGCDYSLDDTKFNSYVAKMEKTALLIAKEGKTRDTAMWYYIAAFMQYLRDDCLCASRTIALAENSYCGNEMMDIIKVFRIYIDAKTLPVNSAYDQKLLAGMRWLDKKVQTEVSAMDFTDFGYDTLSWFIWYMKMNYSQYYWNDMMRRILLGAAAPRYMQNGKPVRAMQVSNIASNRALQIIGHPVDSIRCTIDDGNEIDFSNHYFLAMDSIPARDVECYVETLNHPKSEFDRYAASHGYIDKDYHNDILGSKFIREMNYEKAVEYLSKLPYGYQKRLNTHNDGYMYYDPFATPRTQHIKRDYQTLDYKLNFARRMVSLEKEMQETQDLNRRGVLMLEYSRGINSSADRCWALSYYGIGYVSGNMYDCCGYDNLVATAEKYRKNGFELISDAETKAYMLKEYQCYSTVLNKYPETSTAAFLRSHCDLYNDYR